MEKVAGIDIAEQMRESIMKVAERYVMSVSPQTPEELDALCRQALRNFTAKLNGRDDAIEVIDELVRMAFGRQIDLLMEGELSNWNLRIRDRMEEWLVENIASGKMPASMQSKLNQAVKLANSTRLVRSVQADEIRCHRLWLRGIPVQAIAKKLRLSEAAAEKLLTRAQNKVEKMTKELDAYTKV